MSAYGLHIFLQHVAKLKDSAISPEVARARGYMSIGERSQLKRYGKFSGKCPVPGLLIPLHRIDGSVSGYQYRPDAPRIMDGKPRKYETPYQQNGGIDVPPGIRDKLGDPSAPLLVTEGARKADAAVTAGLCCVSVSGVWNWRGTNAVGGKVALSDWHDIALNGRRVVLAFDSDVTAKRAVRQALTELAGYLAAKGATVEYLHLLDEGDGKTGLDDFLAGHTADELWALVRPEPPAAPTPAEPAHTRTPEPDQPKQVCTPDGVCMHTPLLAHTPDLLEKAVETVHELGVTGENRIIRATYLTAVSQVLEEPVSLAAKGTSSGGKSYSTKTTLRLCPDEDFYKVTAGSQRSLIYTDEDFAHRTIVMFEATALREVAEAREGDMTAMIVRTLLSEGQIIYETTERGNDGKMGTRRIVKSGPTNLIVTTTAANLHQENETRLLSLTVDETEAQTRAVMLKTAARRNQAEPASPPDLDGWHALFHWLKHHGDHQVYIPFAAYLAERATAAVVRMRRDFGVLLGMIEAHAVLHQATRKRDRYGRIIATAADYDAARDVLAEAFAVSAGQQIKETVRRAVLAVNELGGAYSDVTIAQVARHLKRDRTVITRNLREATDLGYLVNQENKPGRPARYRLTDDPLPDDKPALPATLPDEACTPAQDAHLNPQVSDGCAGVQVCTGGAGPVLCTGYAGPMDPALIALGHTDHGGECAP